MMFEAYVTNLGMYPERGVEVGEYLKFPTTIEEVQALFSRIGIDGKRYEESSQRSKLCKVSSTLSRNGSKGCRSRVSWETSAGSLQV